MSTLIVVDAQVDFCEGGALPVEGGQEVCQRIATVIKNRVYDNFIFTRDFHKPYPDDNEGHFSLEPDFKTSWPVHCEAGSDGAKLHPAISFETQDMVDFWDHCIIKGYGHQSYSGFDEFAASIHGDRLEELINDTGSKEVDICGLATDYCVRATALDAISRGFDAGILPELTAAVGGTEAVQRTLDEVAAARQANVD